MQIQGRVKPQTSTDSRAAIRLRSELEAKLLAYRCGWLSRDEIKIRKLERELARLLDELENEDPMARRLIDGSKS